MQQEFADLHLHTRYSDGFSSPEKVVERAKKLGLKCIAISDHDSIDGIEEGLKAGEKHGIEVIPSVEVSATEGDEDIHILGYFIDWKDNDFKKKMLEIQKLRTERMFKMINKLKELGINIDTEKFIEKTKDNFFGRLKLAHYLVNEGLVSSLYEVFDRFIGNGKPAYQEIDAMSYQEAIKMIVNAKGIPVLAHPGLAKRDHLIPEMVKHGLMGLEIYYFSHSPEDIGRYLDLAKKHNLLITGGSDCHGNCNSGILMGKTKLPMVYAEQLKQKAAQMR